MKEALSEILVFDLKTFLETNISKNPGAPAKAPDNFNVLRARFKETDGFLAFHTLKRYLRFKNVSRSFAPPRSII